MSLLLLELVSLLVSLLVSFLGGSLFLSLSPVEGGLFKSVVSSPPSVWVTPLVSILVLGSLPFTFCVFGLFPLEEDF